MKVALTIHGMNSKNGGKNSIDKIAKDLDVDIVDTDDIDYGYALFLRIWFFKGPLVRRIADGIKMWIDNPKIDHIYIFAHSNGLNFALQALKKLKKKGYLTDKPITLVSLSGCANRKINTDNVTELHNWFTRRDGWLHAAKYLPSWSMGSFGKSTYRGKSKNVINKDISKHISGHSEWFSEECLPTTIKKSNELIQETYKNA